MWRPQTEAEIQAGITNGIVRESGSFDAKKQLPPSGKNKDLAKDMCAMTVDGGVLLYGLGGRDPTRPDKRDPFDLAGAAERVDQVAQTGIAEPPVIETYDIPSEEQPGKGYLGVVIPASPRAPHMLTIDGDNRYWGRGATGNRLLSEGEVARLYERRERWEVDRERMLDQTIASMPFTFDLNTTGAMVTIAKPVLPGRELLRIAAGDDSIDTFLQRDLLLVARRRDPYPDQGTSGLGDAYSTFRSGAEIWVCSPQNADPSEGYQARAELMADGTLTYWHSPVINDVRAPLMLIMERSVTRAVYQGLAAAARVYERAGFHGAIDLAVAVMGIESATGATLAQGFRQSVYGQPTYRRHDRVTSEELHSDLDGIVRRLVAPLFEVISTQGYDPLAERTQ
jgi:hypothetical protein